MPRPNEAVAEHPAEAWRQNLRGEHDTQLRGPRPEWWWTGLAPAACPGRQPDGTLTALPQPNLATCTREAVLATFDNCWTLTETLFAGLQGEEAFYRPPYHHLRHPMIFYYCHPAALYINKLRVAGLLSPRARQMGVIVVGLTGLVDVYANFTAATLWFLELPRELLATQRLKRYIRQPDNWRSRWAEDVGVDLLNAADRSGNHLD